MLDQFLRDLIHGELSIEKKKIATLDLLLAVCITGVGALIRSEIFGISNAPALHTEEQMLFFCILDFALAALMALFVWETTEHRLKTVLVYSLAVIWPVFAGNSALNGGHEVEYAVTLMLCFVLVAFGKKYNQKSFWILTILSCMAQIASADHAGVKLTNFWPNIYTLFSETGFVTEYGSTGKLLTVGILLIIFYYISKKKFTVTPELLVASGLFVSLFISAFFPFMNYRSGLVANMFAILMFIQNKKKCYVPMTLCIISYVSYGFFHNGTIGVFFWIYALGLVALMLDAGVELYKQLHTGKTV